MQLGQFPLFVRLDAHQRVLVAGMGGGYDLCSAIPLVEYLERQGREVVFANLSFSGVKPSAGGSTFVEIRADHHAPSDYFPELGVARWFAAEGRPRPIYLLPRAGVRPVRDALKELVSTFACDAILLVDGGIDSLLRGDEAGLGTPAEDLVTLVAAAGLEIPGYLACVGFGVDRFHGVAHAQALEAIAGLTREGSFLGAFSLQRDCDEVKAYIRAMDSVATQFPQHPSIVQSSILAALDGRFGTNLEIPGKKPDVWINPLMTIVWGFELHGVARRLMYRELLESTQTMQEALLRIEGFRKGLLRIKGWQDIPL